MATLAELWIEQLYNACGFWQRVWRPGWWMPLGKETWLISSSPSNRVGYLTVSEVDDEWSGLYIPDSISSRLLACHRALKSYLDQSLLTASNSITLGICLCVWLSAGTRRLTRNQWELLSLWKLTVFILQMAMSRTCGSVSTLQSRNTNSLSPLLYHRSCFSVIPYFCTWISWCELAPGFWANSLIRIWQPEVQQL